MTRAQSYLSHLVSQIPPSESPLNALLTRENAEVINEQTTATINEVTDHIADLESRIHRYPSLRKPGSYYRETVLLRESEEMRSALTERLATLRTKSQQSASEYLAYPSPPASSGFGCFYVWGLMGRELSTEKTKMTMQMKMMTSGVRQFIQDHLARILHAESKGANPGEPESLPKKKRRRDEDDQAGEKDIASRMVTLVEVTSQPLFPPPFRSFGCVVYVGA